MPGLASCAHAPSLDEWLRGLIDGLGLESPRIIIDAAGGQELATLLQYLLH